MNVSSNGPNHWRLTRPTINTQQKRQTPLPIQRKTNYLLADSWTVGKIQKMLSTCSRKYIYTLHMEETLANSAFGCWICKSCLSLAVAQEWEVCTYHSDMFFWATLATTKCHTVKTTQFESPIFNLRVTVVKVSQVQIWHIV